jgi:signal transduction histidine kinase
MIGEISTVFPWRKISTPGGGVNHAAVLLVLVLTGADCTTSRIVPVPESAVSAPKPGREDSARFAVVRDVLLWLALTPSILPLFLDRRTEPTFWWELAGTVLLVGAAVLCGRVRPAVSIFVAALLSMVNVWLSGTLVVMSYLAGRRQTSTRGALLAFAAVLVTGSLLNLVLLTEVWRWLTTVIALPLVMVLPWLAGRFRRQQLELVHGGWDRAVQLEREQHMLAAQARLRERARIAQDMHDTLGHELALIALQAGGLEVRKDLDERHRAAVIQLREAAVRATDTLRDTIGMLRDDDSGPASSEPLRKDVFELVDGARSSGMTVALDVDGEAELSTMAELAARRVVLEALTNSAKHAPGAAVAVRVEHGATGSSITVVNEPPPAGPLPSSVRGGRGLVGLHERVRLAGGSLQAEEVRGGGFRVVARLPHKDGGPDAISDDGDFLQPGQHAARDLVRVRKQARLGLIATVGALTAGVVITGVVTGILIYQTRNSVLSQAEFDRLRTGSSRAEVQRVLPPYEYIQARDPDLRQTPPPAGTSCRYYRLNGDLFSPTDVLRLCFDDTSLVSKDLFAQTG